MFTGAPPFLLHVVYIGPQESDVHLLCSTKPTPGEYMRAATGDAEAVSRMLEKLALG